MHPEQRSFGSYISDAAVLTAGGILGAGLGICRASVPASIVEWPSQVGKLDIEHRFGENVVYNSTARGAVLRMPNGAFYTWNEHRPIFRTNFEKGITTFADGSELRILPGQQVQFKGVGASAADSLWDYKHDLKRDISVLESRPRDGNSWMRWYHLGDGTIVEQHPSSYLVSHSSGKFQELLNPLGIRAPKGKLTIGSDGSRKLIFSENTQFHVQPDGKVTTQGIKKTDFHIQP